MLDALKKSAICMVLAGVGVAAHAQVVIPSTGSFITGGFVGSNGAVRDAMVGATTHIATTPAHPAGQFDAPLSTAAPSTVDDPSLSFRATPAITEALNKKFIAAISAQQPSARAQAEKLFNSGTLTRTFDDLLAKFGYSPDNLADVMTAYMILSWETVHNGDATQYPRGIAAIHQRMRHALAGNPQFATFSDAQKQEFAETLADLAMLSTIARKQMLAKGDAAQLQQLEQNVRETALELGVDVGKLQLTNQGFVAAN